MRSGCKRGATGTQATRCRVSFTAAPLNTGSSRWIGTVIPVTAATFAFSAVDDRYEAAQAAYLAHRPRGRALWLCRHQRPGTRRSSLAHRTEAQQRSKGGPLLSYHPEAHPLQAGFVGDLQRRIPASVERLRRAASQLQMPCSTDQVRAFGRVSRSKSVLCAWASWALERLAAPWWSTWRTRGAGMGPRGSRQRGALQPQSPDQCHADRRAEAAAQGQRGTQPTIRQVAPEETCASSRRTSSIQRRSAR